MSVDASTLTQEVNATVPAAPATRRPSRQWLRIASPLALLILWQIASSTGVVRFADVSPDWLVRTEADAIIEAVRNLVTPGLAARAAADHVHAAVSAA